MIISAFEVIVSEEQLAAPRPSDGAAAELQGSITTVRRDASSSRSRALLRACRPRQWSKNLLVLAAPCAAGLIDRPLVALQVTGAFVVLCLLSSSTYLVNDVRDREQDRVHPTKRLRPVAAGELSPRAALAWAAAAAVVGIAGASAIRPSLGALACGYLILTATYTLKLRSVFILDMLAIAAGFVLRAFAGGVASDIYLSRWFVIVTACGAVFLVAAKRYAELRAHTQTMPLRATLRRYSLSGLHTVALGTAVLGGIAYTGWALTRPSHLIWYLLSIAPFLLWHRRYLLLMATGAGQAPEELILHDRVLLMLSASWSVLFLGGVYVGQ